MFQMYETSYLNTVESAPRGSRKSESLRNARLDTSDVAGAQPRQSLKDYINKPVLHKTTDIDGAQPQRLIPTTVNRPTDRHLRNDDIEQSQPYQNRMRTTRVLDPLNPEYQLPKVIHRPVTPPKFIRPTNEVSDINNDPDYPSVKKPTIIATRDHLDYSDVVGDCKAVPKLKVRTRTEHPTPLQVDDINNDMIFKTKRVTNPLSPRYVYDIPPSKRSRKSDNNLTEGQKEFRTLSSHKNHMESEWQIGQVAGNHPRRLPPMRQDRPLFSLNTEDIEGMKRTHVHLVSRCFPKERREYRQINRIDDIERVHPSDKFTTFAKKSNRSTNPLDPMYKF